MTNAKITNKNITKNIALNILKSDIISENTVHYNSFYLIYCISSLNKLLERITLILKLSSHFNPSKIK